MNGISNHKLAAPGWTRHWLRAAGIYNLAWGALVVLCPNLLFDLMGAERPNYPGIWQCVGMIVGVYGIGYLIAAHDSRTHWPIVLVGLLGKIFGPIGFGIASARGEFPAAFGWTILTNDLLWWIPFAMILWDAAKARAAPTDGAVPLERAMERLTDQNGRTLAELSDSRPVLAILTRHSGCSFCSEQLERLAKDKGKILTRGLVPAVVTMSDPARNSDLARKYGLEEISWFSDPARELYRALDIPRGSFMQLFGPAVWVRGARALLRGHFPGKLDGDGFQMPGTAVLHRGQVLRFYRPRHAGDNPDLAKVACELPQPV
jgi:peroxiredoxin